MQKDKEIRNKEIRNTGKFMIKHWKKLLLIIAFDALFILLLFNLRFILASLNAGIYKLEYSILGVILLYLLLIIEAILLLSIYAFFKYIVIGFISDMFTKRKPEFNQFFSFLKLNLIVSVPIIAILLVFINVTTSKLVYFNEMAASGISNPLYFLFTLLIFIIIAVLVFTYVYTLLNLLHFTFLREKKLKIVTKQAFVSSFKLMSYKLYWSNMKVIFFSLIFLLIVHIFIKLFVLTDVPAYLKYYGSYKAFLYSIIILVGYFLLLFNRINFYRNIVKSGGLVK